MHWQNIVDAGLAENVKSSCLMQLGVAEPTSVMVDTKGAGVETTEKMDEIVRENFNLTPDGIIETLDLRHPIYKQTAKYGHFGIEGLPWEATDKVEDLKKFIK